MLNIELKNNYILPFRFKKLKSGNYFLSNDSGEWVVLKNEDFNKFINGDVLEPEIENLLISHNLYMDPQYDENSFIEKMSARWLLRYSYLLHGPRLHIIVVSLKCNQSCKYCHASAKNDPGNQYNMDKKLAKKIVDTIFNTTSGDINIEFQGGEPLCNFEIVRFITEYAREKNKKLKLKLVFSLVTNLTLMDDEKLEFLIADDIGISTSIDGPKEVHDFNRLWVGGGSSFDVASGWIKKINKIYEEKGIKNRVGAIGTATRKLLDKPQELVDTYIDLGIENLFIRPLNPFGYAKSAWEKIGYNYNEYLEFYEKFKSYINKKKEEGIRIKDVYSDNICYANLYGQQRVNYMEERNPCGAVLGQVAYNWDGGIYTCDEGRMLSQTGDSSFQIGKIDNRKPEIIYKEMILNYVTKIMIYSSLIDFIPGYDQNPISNFIGSCPVYSYSKYGNIMSKYKKEDRYKIQEYIFDKLVDK